MEAGRAEQERAGLMVAEVRTERVESRVLELEMVHFSSPFLESRRTQSEADGRYSIRLSQSGCRTAHTVQSSSALHSLRPTTKSPTVQWRGG